MRIRVGYRIGYEFEQPTPLIALLNVHYSRVSDLERPDTMVVDPPAGYTSYRDGYGNWCNRVQAPGGSVTLRAETVVRDRGLPDPVPRDGRQLEVQDLPEEALVYLLASRFCESDLLTEAAWDMFGTHERGWPLVHAISSWVHQHITFDHEAARPTKSALDAFREGRGVCRDFAHLGVALCRAMNVPARYCTGYLGDIDWPYTGPMDFSGWFEVYLSGGWYTVDPRNFHPRIGRILMARGRDAADVALTTTFGPNTLTRFEVISEQLPADPGRGQGG